MVKAQAFLASTGCGIGRVITCARFSLVHQDESGYASVLLVSRIDRVPDGVPARPGFVSLRWSGRSSLLHWPTCPGRSRALWQTMTSCLLSWTVCYWITDSAKSSLTSRSLEYWSVIYRNVLKYFYCLHFVHFHYCLFIAKGTWV